ncbi:Uncharacterized protein HZ326_31644, partial [Fusarium oxysporum f. sp. albedinis]
MPRVVLPDPAALNESLRNPLPTYSAVDNDDLLTRIEAAGSVEFPILHSPAGRPTNLQRLTADVDWATYDEAYRVESDIVNAFFSVCPSTNTTSLSSITSSCGCAPIVPVLAAASSYCAYTSRTTLFASLIHCLL